MIRTVTAVAITKKGEKFHLSRSSLRIKRGDDQLLRFGSKFGTICVEWGHHGNPFTSASECTHGDVHILEFGPVPKDKKDGDYEFVAILSKGAVELGRFNGHFLLHPQPIGDSKSVEILVNGEVISPVPDVTVNRTMEEQVSWVCKFDFTITFDGPRGSPFEHEVHSGNAGTPKLSGGCRRTADLGQYKYNIEVRRPNKPPLHLDPIVDVDDDGGDT